MVCLTKKCAFRGAQLLCRTEQKYEVGVVSGCYVVAVDASRETKPRKQSDFCTLLVCGLWKALSLVSTLCSDRKIKGGGYSEAVNISKVVFVYLLT